MANEPTTNEPQPTGADVTPEGGAEAGLDAVETATNPESTADVSNLSLEDLNKALGKDFKTKDAALSSLREAQRTLSQKQQELAQLKETGGSDDRIAALEKEVHNANFYSEHPELKPYKAVISSLGSDPEAVLADPQKKEVLDKLIAHDEADKSKSVLMSNPRLGQVTDKITEAKQELNAEQPNFAKAEKNAVDAVIDAYQL